MNDMIKSKAEKILMKYYKEINTDNNKTKRIHRIENIIKVALIVNFMLLTLVPSMNALKLDLSISDKSYKSDLEYIVKNIAIYEEK